MLRAELANAIKPTFRELENIIERALILSPGPGLVLDEQLHLEPAATGEQPRTLKEMEMGLILDALRASNWVIEGKRGAANRLDIPPSTWRERMQRAGIKRPSV